jgi:hypothetical protein
MNALHLQTAGGPVVVVFGATLSELRMIAVDLLRCKRYLAARIFDRDARLMEHIET